MSGTDKRKRHGPQREGTPAERLRDGTLVPRLPNNGAPPTVLIVEDEEPIAEALAYLVQD